MKNRLIKASVIAVATLLLASCSKDKLADDFASPPQTMATGVYWYWMSDNISKEGVVKDLQAMKKAGINAVFIGNIADDTPYGKVKLFSDEWWDVLHTTMKTAGELGIEVGMFNCPGWSHTGGPWIKAGQSMRHIVASETRVTGGSRVNVKLPVPEQPAQYEDWGNIFYNYEGKPSPYFQDVRTLAVPVPENYRYNLFDAAGARVTVANMRPLAGASLDRPTQVKPTSPLAARFVVPKEEEASITLHLPEAQDARSLSIYPASHCRGDGELQAKVDGHFVTVATFPLYRVFPIPSIGATPFAPTVVGFRKVTSDEYRIVFRHIERDAAIGKVVLSPTAELDKYPEKTLARMYQGANPPWTEYKWTAVLDVPSADAGAQVAAPEQILDITDRMQPDGTLEWDAPAGEWLVLRMGMV
ncbi:MAG: glycoside hydrolase family 2, partial [Tannerellaceae bacterium]|nr:glycoside hydrolase family 2 [Tannerellaceae bacterium]